MADRGGTVAIAMRVVFSRPRLAAMMFLEYAIWGAWEPPLSGYLAGTLGFSGFGLALIYNALPMMTLLAPITAGQLADRLLPAQRALAIFHLAGAVALFSLSFVRGLGSMTVLMLAYALVFAPTLALTNSVALQHLEDPQRDFGPMRMWGTLGWISANWALSLLRSRFGSMTWAAIDVFALAGVFSVALGLLSFALPSTPPSRQAADPFAFRRALALLKNRDYAVFLIIAFVVATELRLYYMLTFPFLQATGAAVGITPESLPAWMTIGQIAEIVTIALVLPYVLPRWGVRRTLLIGIMAWPVRYVAFAVVWRLHDTMPGIVWIAIASLALHGFCYVFFFVVAFIYTDAAAPRDIRSSAQALVNVVVLGVGLLVGGFFAGWLKDAFTRGATTEYSMVFLIPAGITAAAAVLFAALFRDSRPMSA